jgi:hypothetical protein
MLEVEYPEPSFKMKKQGENNFLFDPVRKKWLLLTPEEWVRQNFVQHLVQVKGYPVTMIAMEKVIMLGELRKRFDILVYDREHRPWLMVECKSPDVELNDSVLHQLLRYHISVPAGLLVITNGTSSYAWIKKEGQLHGIHELPEWSMV